MAIASNLTRLVFLKSGVPLYPLGPEPVGSPA
jgi:hypothetical protein